jgi:hypothetical protein
MSGIPEPGALIRVLRGAAVRKRTGPSSTQWWSTPHPYLVQVTRVDPGRYGRNNVQKWLVFWNSRKGEEHFAYLDDIEVLTPLDLLSLTGG